MRLNLRGSRVMRIHAKLTMAAALLLLGLSNGAWVGQKPCRPDEKGYLLTLVSAGNSRPSPSPPPLLPPCSPPRHASPAPVRPTLQHQSMDGENWKIPWDVSINSDPCIDSWNGLVRAHRSRSHPPAHAHPLAHAHTPKCTHTHTRSPTRTHTNPRTHPHTHPRTHPPHTRTHRW